MNKLNNKGFIATSVLYGITTIFIVTMAIILNNSLASRKYNNSLIEDAKEDLSIISKPEVYESIPATAVHGCPEKYTYDETTDKCTITEYKQDASCGTTTQNTTCGGYLISYQVRSDGMNTFNCNKGHTGVNVTSISPDYVMNYHRCDYPIGTTTVINSCNVTSTTDPITEYRCPEGMNLNGTICEWIFTTPKMTSDTTCEDDTNPLCGTISASNYRDGSPPYLAFDGVEDILTGWKTKDNGTPTGVGSEYIIYKFKRKVEVSGYNFFLYNIAGQGMYYNTNSNITVEVSNDGENWTKVQTDTLSPGTKHTINFSSKYKAKYFKLIITGYNSYFSYSTNNFWIGITEMSIKGKPI